MSLCEEWESPQKVKYCCVLEEKVNVAAVSKIPGKMVV